MAEQAKTLQIYTDGTISHNGSDKHGHAVYTYDVTKDQGSWELTFHCRGDEAKARTHMVNQIPGTAAFFLKGQTSEWNAIMLPKA